MTKGVRTTSHWDGKAALANDHFLIEQLRCHLINKSLHNASFKKHVYTFFNYLHQFEFKHGRDKKRNYNDPRQ